MRGRNLLYEKTKTRDSSLRIKVEKEVEDRKQRKIKELNSQIKAGEKELQEKRDRIRDLQISHEDRKNLLLALKAIKEHLQKGNHLTFLHLLNYSDNKNLSEKHFEKYPLINNFKLISIHARRRLISQLKLTCLRIYKKEFDDLNNDEQIQVCLFSEKIIQERKDKNSKDLKLLQKEEKELVFLQAKWQAELRDLI